MPLAELEDGRLVPVAINLSPLAFADTAEIDLSKPSGENVDGALHLALPLAESHSELLDLASDCRALLLVHGPLWVGERAWDLCERLERAIRKGEGLR